MSPPVRRNIYRLKSGLFQLSYRDPITCKRVRRKFKLIAEAVKFESLLQANGTNSSSALSIAEWLKLYLEAKPDAFIKRLGEPLFLSFLEAFGEKPTMEVVREELLAWLNELRAARNYSDRTLPNIKSAINQFFHFVVDAGGLKVNPMAKIKIEGGLPKRERVVLSETEVEDLISRIKEVSPNIIYPVIFLIAHSGARLGEILKLQWKDVRFDLGALHLLKTKNGEDRLVHVSPQVLNFLAELSRSGDHVLSNIHGRPWTVAQYNKQFRKVRSKVAFEKYFSNHSLRHSFASNYQKQGGDMRQLQAILGHNDLKMTVDLYGKIESSDVHEPSPFGF